MKTVLLRLAVAMLLPLLTCGLAQPIPTMSAESMESDIREAMAAGADLDELHAGFTFLMRAAMSGHPDHAAILLAAGANPDVQDQYGWTALMRAVQNGHYEVVRLLLQAGARTDLLIYDDTDVLLVAADGGRSGIMQELIDGGADVTHADELGFTALISASYNADALAVQVLLDAGADPEARTAFDNWTPILHALHRGPAEVIEVLLDAGAEVLFAGDLIMNLALENEALAGTTVLERLREIMEGD